MALFTVVQSRWHKPNSVCVFVCLFVYVGVLVNHQLSGNLCHQTSESTAHLPLEVKPTFYVMAFTEQPGSHSFTKDLTLENRIVPFKKHGVGLPGSSLSVLETGSMYASLPPGWCDWSATAGPRVGHSSD